MPFSDLVGHRRLLRLLSRALASDSLPPSLIFAGPDGVGKRAVAIAVAQTLNCLERGGRGSGIRLRSSYGGQVGERGAGIGDPPSRKLRRTSRGTAIGDEPSPEYPRDACGACPACRRIARGVHPDVLLIEPGETGSIKVDPVRDAIDHAGYRPFEGSRRVVILDEADRMVPQAQNALLKTLEEPPPCSVFILVTSRPDALLPTVRSRCPCLRFGPLDPQEIAGVLIQCHQYKDNEARAAAAVANGSLSRALEAESGGFTAARDAAYRLLRHVATLRDPRRRLEMARDQAKTRDKRESRTSERDEVGGQLRALASLLRDLGILTTRAPDTALANLDLRADLEALVQSFDSDRVVRAFLAVDRASNALDRNASPKLVSDWLALQL